MENFANVENRMSRPSESQGRRIGVVGWSRRVVGSLRTSRSRSKGMDVVFRVDDVETGQNMALCKNEWNGKGMTVAGGCRNQLRFGQPNLARVRDYECCVVQRIVTAAPTTLDVTGGV